MVIAKSSGENTAVSVDAILFDLYLIHDIAEPNGDEEGGEEGLQYGFFDDRTI